jgi:GNAT superfamily N-acetyltransferase
MTEIVYRVRPPVTNADLNPLFFVSWPKHEEWDFSPILERSLLWVCAYVETRLIGYVNLAWDGGVHGFILDTTVHPDYRRQGIGVQLVKTAIEAARQYDLEWIHVDYEPHLEAFYIQCGFRPSAAGILRM